MKSRFFVFLIIFFIAACRPSYESHTTSALFYSPSPSEESTPDSGMLKFISPYRDSMNNRMNEVLAWSPYPIEKGQPESRLGNFVADLCYNISGKYYIPSDGVPVDFCVLNNGGLRSSLPQGNVTLKNVFELMPFENELVVVTINSDSVMKLMQYIALKGGVPVSNLTMKIHDGSPGQVLIQGVPVNSEKTSYKVLTSDYLANGGDGMWMFGGAIKTESVGIKVRDAIVLYLKNLGENHIPIKAETDGRISL